MVDITAIIEWVWTVSAAWGILFFLYISIEARKEYRTARNTGNPRLILVTRPHMRNTLSWMVAFMFFFLVGISALLRSNPPQSLLDLVNPILLVTAVVLVTYSAYRNFQDTKALYRLILQDVKAKKKAGGYK